MDIEAFLLCDAATDQHGKLNILGAFDRIFAGEVPMTHPACSVAARIRFDRIEEGQHEVRLLMIDQDGKTLGPKLKANANIQFIIPFLYSFKFHRNTLPKNLFLFPRKKDLGHTLLCSISQFRCCNPVIWGIH